MNKHILLLTASVVLANCQTYPTVCMDGDVCYRGAWLNSTMSKYASFQGIRYAVPPIGDLRFKSPQKYMEEGGIIDVSNELTVMCSQIDQKLDGTYTIRGQEDCLFLNVYVPNVAFNDPQVKLPVMVWIHGGSLITGSNNYQDYGPMHFIDKNVIIVTVNYRLGPFGFLVLGNDMVPGNAGLKDQVLALEWVQENIANFGGDPGSITIFGESAGSFSVAVHLLSPLSEKLFQRAILQSRSAIGPSWTPITPKHGIACAELVAKNLGCSQHKEDILECLQAQSMANILEQTNSGYTMLFSTCWMAVQDSELTTEPFLIGDPEELMSTGQFNTDVEIIIGTNKDEGILNFFGQLLNPSLWEDWKNGFDIYGPMQLFDISGSDITSKDVENAHKILDYYIGSVENINTEHQQGIFDMMTDATFLYGTHRTIKHMIEHGVTVYEYILTYQGSFSLTQVYGIDPIGVCHGDDLGYQWEPLGGSLHWNMEPLTPEEASIMNTIVTAWTDFSKYGDPTPPDSGKSWIPQAPNSEQQYWNISGPEPHMDTSSYIQERMALWENILGVK